jgi:pyruvate formate lyase activating enzyme
VTQLGLVADTIEFSSVDGPGNRFVVFLQGCNLDCLACHNPQTINPCIDCGECVAGCPTGALGFDAAWQVTWDETLCGGGDRCLRVCPYDSTPKARRLAVVDLLDRIRPAAPFLSGITVSGGEAAEQAPFVRALFAAVHADPALARLTCFVDTNGHAARATWELLSDVTDGVMVDLKCLDSEVHRRLTGQGNDRVLASIEWLAGRGLLHEVRLLILPGHNDDPELIEATGRWLAEIDPRMRVVLIGFRTHGVREGPVPLVEATPEDLERCAAILRPLADFTLVVV